MKREYHRQGHHNSIRPCGQAVKTAPSHGAIPGSIPGKVTKKTERILSVLFFCAHVLGTEPVVRPAVGGTNVRAGSENREYSRQGHHHGEQTKVCSLFRSGNLDRKPIYYVAAFLFPASIILDIFSRLCYNNYATSI